MPRSSKHGCRKGERFSATKKKKGDPPSGCYIPSKSGRKLGRKKCSKGQVYVKKVRGCMSRCRMPYRRMSKSPYHCRLTRKQMSGGLSKKRHRKRSGGVAFLA